MAALWRKILTELLTSPTCSVPTAGAALANLSENGSYEAAKRGTLGVPVIEVGRQKRVPSHAVLRRLGLAEDGTPLEQPTAKDRGRKPRRT
jgi:hypothetical protein